MTEVTHIVSTLRDTGPSGTAPGAGELRVWDVATGQEVQALAPTKAKTRDVGTSGKS